MSALSPSPFLCAPRSGVGWDYQYKTASWNPRQEKEEEKKKTLFKRLSHLLSKHLYKRRTFYQRTLPVSLFIICDSSTPLFSFPCADDPDPSTLMGATIPTPSLHPCSLPLLPSRTPSSLRRHFSPNTLTSMKKRIRRRHDLLISYQFNIHSLLLFPSFTISTVLQLVEMSLRTKSFFNFCFQISSCTSVAERGFCLKKFLAKNIWHVNYLQYLLRTTL